MTAPHTKQAEPAHLNASSLSPAQRSAIIAMAWADEVPFAAITKQYGLSEAQIIALMRRELKRGSFALWRARVTGRKAKHPQREIAKQRWAQATYAED